MTTPETTATSWTHRRVSLVGVLLLVFTAAFTALAPDAAAHDALISSNPVADSVIASAPTRIELVFDQDVKDFQPKVAITITGHDPVEVVPTVSGRTVTADLAGVDLPGGAATEPASWRIGYRVVSADGHPVSGLLNFSVGSAPADIEAPSAENPAQTGNSAAVSGASDSSASVQTGGIQWWWWIVVGALAVAAAAVVVWLSRRRAVR